MKKILLRNLGNTYLQKFVYNNKTTMSFHFDHIYETRHVWMYVLAVVSRNRAKHTHFFLYTKWEMLACHLCIFFLLDGGVTLFRSEKRKKNIKVLLFTFEM